MPFSSKIAISARQRGHQCYTTLHPSLWEAALPHHLTPHVNRKHLRVKPRQLPTTLEIRSNARRIFYSPTLLHAHPRLTNQRLLHLDQPIQVSESLHHFHDCPVQIQSSHVKQCGMTNVITNSNDEKAIIPPEYFSMGEIIAMLSTMTDTTFSISTKDSSNGCIWIQSPHTIDFANALDIREIFGLEERTVILPTFFFGSNVVDISRNRQVVHVYLSLV